jgi:hypothetical protein
MENAPRWFLTVAVVALVAVLPLLVSQESRMTKLETNMTAVRESNARLIFVLDRLDNSVDSLNATVASLKVEIKNIKER